MLSRDIIRNKGNSLVRARLLTTNRRFREVFLCITNKSGLRNPLSPVHTFPPPFNSQEGDAMHCKPWREDLIKECIHVPRAVPRTCSKSRSVSGFRCLSSLRGGYSSKCSGLGSKTAQLLGLPPNQGRP